MRKNGHLEPDDEGAFQDMVKKPYPAPDTTTYKMGKTVECPLCHGYGGWNLKLHCFGEGEHFQAVCSNCHGRGYVEPKYADHIHDWKLIGRPRMTIAIYKCNICGKRKEIDSSD